MMGRSPGSTPFPSRLQVQGRRLCGLLAGQPASVIAGTAARVREAAEELGLDWEAAVAEV